MIYDQTSLIFYQKWVYTFSKSWSLSLAYDFEPDLRLFGMISQTLTTIYALVRPKPVKRRLPSLETSTQPLRIADLNG